MVRCYDEGCRHCSVGSGPAVAGEAGRAFACYGGDDPGCVHLADDKANTGTDVEVVGPVHGHARGRAYRNAGRRLAIAPGSAGNRDLSVAATVVMRPDGSTLRTRLLPASA